MYRFSRLSGLYFCPFVQGLSSDSIDSKKRKSLKHGGWYYRVLDVNLGFFLIILVQKNISKDQFFSKMDQFLSYKLFFSNFLRFRTQHEK